MGHIRLKPGKEYKVKVDPKELKNIEIPEESKAYVQDYITYKKLADDDNLDIMIEQFF